MNSKKNIKTIHLGSGNSRYRVNCDIDYEYIKDKLTPIKYHIYSKTYESCIVVDILFYFEININDTIEKLFVFQAICWSNGNFGHFEIEDDLNEMIDNSSRNSNVKERNTPFKYQYAKKRYDRIALNLIQKLYNENLDNELDLEKDKDSYEKSKELYENVRIISELNIDQIKKDVIEHVNRKISENLYVFDDNPLIEVAQDVIDYDYLSKEINKIKEESKRIDMDLSPFSIGNMYRLLCYFISDSDKSVETNETSMSIEIRDVENVRHDEKYVFVSIGKGFDHHQTLLTYKTVHTVWTNIQSTAKRAIDRIPNMKSEIDKADERVRKILESLTAIK